MRPEVQCSLSFLPVMVIGTPHTSEAQGDLSREVGHVLSTTEDVIEQCWISVSWLKRHFAELASGSGPVRWRMTRMMNDDRFMMSTWVLATVPALPHLVSVSVLLLCLSLSCLPSSFNVMFVQQEGFQQSANRVLTFEILCC